PLLARALPEEPDDEAPTLPVTKAPNFDFDASPFENTEPAFVPEAPPGSASTVVSEPTLPTAVQAPPFALPPPPPSMPRPPPAPARAPRAPRGAAPPARGPGSRPTRQQRGGAVPAPCGRLRGDAGPRPRAAPRAASRRRKVRHDARARGVVPRRSAAAPSRSS